MACCWSIWKPIGKSICSWIGRPRVWRPGCGSVRVWRSSCGTARQRALEAQQVADRFPILLSASAAVDEVLRSRRRRLDDLAAHAPRSAPPVTAEVVRLSATKRQQLARRARRLERWEAIWQRRAAGQSIRQITRSPGYP
jgi:hypothetical protein